LRVVRTSVGDLKLFGGELCLDFINTIDWRTRSDAQEFLASYFDLVDWSEQLGAIKASEARALSARARRFPSKARAALAQALLLREAMYRIFLAVAGDRGPDPPDMSQFNSILSGLMKNAALTGDTRFEWAWAGETDALERVMWPIVWCGASLLTSDRAQRVRECAAEGCGWLFIDVSKNGRRQWCNMQACGNRAKARRHYERVRSSE
jgi:predicted RNA-binding Zn ribbon-like protein